jgi:hypothetical protein
MNSQMLHLRHFSKKYHLGLLQVSRLILLVVVVFLVETSRNKIASPIDAHRQLSSKMAVLILFFIELCPK